MSKNSDGNEEAVSWDGIVAEWQPIGGDAQVLNVRLSEIPEWPGAIAGEIIRIYAPNGMRICEITIDGEYSEKTVEASLAIEGNVRVEQSARTSRN